MDSGVHASYPQAVRSRLAFRRILARVSSVSGGQHVRVTVHPGEDVLLPVGRTVASLRDELADLLRRPEARHEVLLVDDVAVADSSVVGERPLIDGATVRLGGGGRRLSATGDEAALRSPWVVSRISGDGSGELFGLAPRSPLMLSDGVEARVGSRGTVQVRARRRGTAARLEGRQRPRRVGPLWRRWNAPDVLSAGDRYEIHPAGDAAVVLAGARSLGPSTSDGSTSGSNGIGLTLAAALLPVLGSVGLAVALRQPTFALFSLVGLLAAIPQVIAAVRRHREGRTGARSAVRASAGPVRTSAAVDPGRVARATVAAVQASEAVWRAAQESRDGGTRSVLDGPRTSVGLPVADGAVAVRGPVELARAAARAIVAELAARGSAVTVTGAGRSAWSWCRWLDRDGDSDARVLVVDSPDAAALDAARETRRSGDVVVLCLPLGADVPSWCRETLDVGPGASAVRTTPARGAVAEPFVGVSAVWAERVARRLAAGRALGRPVSALWAPLSGPGPEGCALPASADPSDARLPAVVPLAGLLADAAEAPAWAVPLGRDAAGRVVTFDLVADGPHLLVAGTTGAGKSELLQSFVLGLALRRSPAELALALVDFKGGASFGACAGLPHVVGQVTDLDAGLAARALEGLRAELRRRKEVLAAHGAGDIDALPGGVLPRLVVVVDEFRALADDLPELLPGLLRVAAQGRSLGVHLVLATQRPAGAVSADVRANVSARLALRVVDVADSHDVLDSPAAASIPAGVPGRAVLRVGAAEPVALQCAYAGAVPEGAGSVVRAPGWDDVVAGHQGSDLLPTAADRTDDEDPVVVLVEQARAAAGDSPRWPAPWLPPLPARVELGALEAESGGGLPLGLGDLPSSQAQSSVVWEPAAGHLAVLGRARSGRTTALRTLAVAALARGWHVHALVPAAGSGAFAELASHLGFGTLAGPDDVRRARRLLRLLQGVPAGGPRVLVVVDGVEELRSALMTASHDPLMAALASGSASFAVTGESGGLGGLSARFGPRLVLLSGDASADLMLGAPGTLAGRGRVAGRGVWLGAGDAVECQVAVVAEVDVHTTQESGRSADLDPATALVPRSAQDDEMGRVVRVRPLPRVVSPQDLRGKAGVPFAPLVGVGGDDAVQVRLDISAGALVVGPRGSGRSNALRTILSGIASDAAADAVVVGRDRRLVGAAAELGATVLAPSAVGLRELLELLANAPSPRLVLVDDVDSLVQACPLETDRLAELAVEGRAVVVASSTTMNACLAHRGLLAHLRAARAGVVLAPAERGSEDVFGCSLEDAVEPGVQLAGRGALVVDGVAVPVQLAAPAVSAASSSPRPRAA